MKIRFRKLRWQEWIIFLFVLPLLFSGPVLAGSYLQSAHGDSTTFGVCREGICDESSGTNFGYSRGNCANCHEQHASIGGVTIAPSPYMLFSSSKAPYLSQSKNVCFYCHNSSTTSSLQVGGIINYDFSRTFGGAPITITGIQGAFNITTSPSSSHNLTDIYKYITGVSGSHPLWTKFPPFSSPCSGCHNVHIAKRNKSTPGDPANTAISRPSDHGNLWGDESGETLRDYTTSYQPPYYYSGSSTKRIYEPDGQVLPALPGSNMPDYVTFCLDCHQYQVPITQSEPASINPNTPSGYLTAIDWSAGTGDQHGKYPYLSTGTRTIKPPYSQTSGTNYVLSCLDCHEPHGSPNVRLIRREVNGSLLSGTVGTGTSDYGYLCRQCHTDDQDYDSKPNSWQYVHHVASGHPYKEQRPCWPCHGRPWQRIKCENCHFHGGTDAWLTTQTTSPPRKTF